jgi:hypothetical protein
MSLPKTKEGLLTAKEWQRLQDNDLDPKIRVRNDMIIRKKLDTWLSGSKDAFRVLDYISRKHIKNIASDEIIFSLLDMVEELLFYSDIGPIFGKPEDAIVVNDTAQNNIKRIEIDNMKDIHTEYFYREKRLATESDFEKLLRIEKGLALIKGLFIADTSAYKHYKEEKFKDDLSRLSKTELSDDQVHELLFFGSMHGFPASLRDWNGLFTVRDTIHLPEPAKTTILKAKNLKEIWSILESKKE